MPTTATRVSRASMRVLRITVKGRLVDRDTAMGRILALYPASGRKVAEAQKIGIAKVQTPRAHPIDAIYVTYYTKKAINLGYLTEATIAKRRT